MKAPRIQRTFGSSTNLGRVVFAAFLIVALTGGCHKQHISPMAQEEGIEPTDPQVVDNLAQLTSAVTRATRHHHDIVTFEGFVAVSPDVEVPPPPPGLKYAIGKGRKVVLVANKTK